MRSRGDLWGSSDYNKAGKVGEQKWSGLGCDGGEGWGVLIMMYTSGLGIRGSDRDFKRRVGGSLQGPL